MSKQLYTLEYPVRCSPSILFEFLSTPAGLQEWFADKVDERDNVFFFSWNGSSQRAEVLESQEEKFIRFHWLDAPKEEYFEILRHMGIHTVWFGQEPVELTKIENSGHAVMQTHPELIKKLLLHQRVE